jgi:hypothetical protein
MLLKSFSGTCCTLVHAIAAISAAVSLYFFLGSSIELIFGALIMLGVAIAFEVIAVLVSDGPTAHT